MLMPLQWAATRASSTASICVATSRTGVVRPGDQVAHRAAFGELHRVPRHVAAGIPIEDRNDRRVRELGASRARGGSARRPAGPARSRMEHLSATSRSARDRARATRSRSPARETQNVVMCGQGPSGAALLSVCAPGRCGTVTVAGRVPRCARASAASTRPTSSAPADPGATPCRSRGQRDGHSGRSHCTGGTSLGGGVRREHREDRCRQLPLVGEQRRHPPLVVPLRRPAGPAPVGVMPSGMSARANSPTASRGSTAPAAPTRESPARWHRAPFRCRGDTRRSTGGPEHAQRKRNVLGSETANRPPTVSGEIQRRRYPGPRRDIGCASSIGTSLDRWMVRWPDGAHHYQQAVCAGSGALTSDSEAPARR